MVDIAENDETMINYVCFKEGLSCIERRYSAAIQILKRKLGSSVGLLTQLRIVREIVWRETLFHVEGK